MIALPRLLRCRHGSAIRSKHTTATYFLGLALDDTPYWRNTRFGTLQRICRQNAKFGTRRRSFGQNARFGTRRRAFAGRIAGFGIFSWQDGRFGTRPLARSAVWYPRKRVVVFVTWGFFGPWVPNRRSWLETGNQTASFCQRQGRDGPVRYQTTSFCQRKGRSPRAAPNRSIREMLSGTLSDDATMAALALMGCAGRRASRRRRRRATEGNRGETPLLYQEP